MAERLADREPDQDVMGLARAYYAMTGDVDDRRRGRFLAHIVGAEARGEALCGLLPRGGRVMEVGCGAGGFLVAAARAGRAVVGVDIALRWLVVARRRLADRGVSVPLVGASVARLPWPEASFDVVVADSVLEHVNDPETALAEMVRVLRPGGQVLVWSPNRFSLATDPHVGLWGVGWLPRRWAEAYVRRRRGDVWLPRLLSAQDARRLAQAAGLVDARVEPSGIPGMEARSRMHKAALIGYERACEWRLTRRMLRAVGPLWELRARKTETELA